jgi:hypothetical protein
LEVACHGSRSNVFDGNMDAWWEILWNSLCW